MAKPPDLSQYEQLDSRMRTFTSKWKGSLDAHSMSEAGFVYSGQEDLAYCFNCNIKLDGWTKHMDPLLRHKEESPTCSFVRQQLQVIKGEKGKVELVVAPSKHQIMSSIVQSNSLPYFSHQPVHTIVTGFSELQLPNERREDDCSGSVIRTNYQSEVERMESFASWPLEHLVHAEQLAKVGFVYTGEGSLVQCFQCGVRYRNWLKGDIPLSVHQRYNPDCVFLQSLSCKSKKQSLEQGPRLKVKQKQGGSSKTYQLRTSNLPPLSGLSRESIKSKKKDGHSVFTTLDATSKIQQSVVGI